MAKHANLKALFTAIANSIRNKTGGADAIIADDFPEAIDGIQTGGGVDKIQRYIELQGNIADSLFVNFKGRSVDELLDGVDTSKVTSAHQMFSGCNFLDDIPSFDTSNVTNMNYMFYGCKGLETVPLLNTSNVTDMTYMFSGCKNLTTVPAYDTSNVTNMNSMFYECKGLETVPLLNTSNVTDMTYMFLGCENLTTVPAFDMRNVTTGAHVLHNSKALTECWLRNIKINFQVSDGSSYGHLLTLESLLSLCKECRNVNASRTLTVGTANLNKLANVYVKLIPITDDMRAEDDLIDEKYPFVQCESTDEGAMTIADYMTTKMWTLK